MVEWMGECMSRYIGERMCGWLHGWVDEWVDEWMGGWMDL